MDRGRQKKEPKLFTLLLPPTFRCSSSRIHTYMLLLQSDCHLYQICSDIYIIIIMMILGTCNSFQNDGCCFQQQQIQVHQQQQEQKVQKRNIVSNVRCCRYNQLSRKQQQQQQPLKLSIVFVVFVQQLFVVLVLVVVVSSPSSLPPWMTTITGTKCCTSNTKQMIMMVSSFKINVVVQHNHNIPYDNKSLLLLFNPSLSFQIQQQQQNRQQQQHIRYLSLLLSNQRMLHSSSSSSSRSVLFSNSNHLNVEMDHPLSSIAHPCTSYPILQNDIQLPSEMNTITKLQHSVPDVQIVHEMPSYLNPTQLKNRYYLLRHGQSIANVNEIISSNRTNLSYSNIHGLTELGYEQGYKNAAHTLYTLLKQTTQPNDTILFISSPFARARQTAVACLRGLQEIVENEENENTLQIEIQYDTLVINHLLVERSFGKLDNEAIYTYAYVWPLDQFNSTHTTFDVESVAAVCTRIRTLIEQCELFYPPKPYMEHTSSNTTTTTTTTTNQNNITSLPVQQEQQQQQQQQASSPQSEPVYDDSKNKSPTNHIVFVSHADVLQIAQLYGAHSTNVGTFSSYRFKNGEVREMKIGDCTHLPEPSPLQKPDRTTKTMSSMLTTK